MEVDLHSFFTSALDGAGGQRHAFCQTPPKSLITIVQGGLQFWCGEKISLAVTGVRIPDRPARVDLLYGLSYPGTTLTFELDDGFWVLTLRMQHS